MRPAPAAKMILPLAGLRTSGPPISSRQARQFNPSGVVRRRRLQSLQFSIWYYQLRIRVKLFLPPSRRTEGRTFARPFPTLSFRTREIV
jgi:hypothetical protein